MNHPPARRRPRSAVVLALLFALTALTAPASAHSQLIDSSPAPDEVLTTAPSEVTLEFNEVLIEVGSAVLVIGADGENIAGEAVLDGRFIRAELPADLPDGSYEVRWRVVSADGHPINGRIPFAVGAPGDPVPEAPSADDPGTTDATPSDGWSAGRVAVIGATAAVLALALWWLLRARRRP